MPERTDGGGAATGNLPDQIRDYAIIGLDPEGVIGTWNVGAELLKGYSAGEAVGRHFSLFYTEADRVAGLPGRLLDRARRDGRVEHTGWRVRKDGSRFWADVVITALHDDAGALTGFVKVTRDLTDQHLLEASLRESEERFRVLVSQVRDYAILGLDPDGVVTTWNAGAELLKGWTEAEAVGLHFSSFYTEADRDAGLPARLLDRARRDGRVHDTGWRVRKDGSRFWADVVITALHDDAGALTGYAKVTRDLTDRRAAEEARDVFLASVSHDLRAPLTAIRGFAQLLRDEADPDVRAEFVERVESNAVRLTTMVDLVLEHARLRAGQTTLAPEPSSLSGLLQDRLDDLAATLRGHEVCLAGEDVQVAVDREAFGRMVDNLVTNAVKYSPPGTRIELTTQAGPGVGRLVVRDEGRGIAPADVERVFDPFERGERAEGDGGTGLGLSNVRMLAELSGGRVWLTSEPGDGTSATLELPAVPPEPAQGTLRPRR